MKRDDELIRRILIELIESPEAYSEEFIFLRMSEDERIRSYHLQLLLDSKLVEIQDQRRFYINDEMPSQEGRVFSRCQTFRVTNDGQDFYSATRDDGIWKRTKRVVAEEGGSVALELIKSLAIGFAKKQIEDRTGFKL